ncbi:hypothetical protein AHAS_Ahas04G0183400 [Arachis hypogaea]
MDMTELETDETERGHIVVLDLVYHSLNSCMLGVVAVRYKLLSYNRQKVNM